MCYIFLTAHRETWYNLAIRARVSTNHRKWSTTGTGERCARESAIFASAVHLQPDAHILTRMKLTHNEKGGLNMKLFIDGHSIQPGPDQSLLDMIRQLGLHTGKLSTDPLVLPSACMTFPI